MEGREEQRGKQTTGDTELNFRLQNLLPYKEIFFFLRRRWITLIDVSEKSSQFSIIYIYNNIILIYMKYCIYFVFYTYNNVYIVHILHVCIPLHIPTRTPARTRAHAICTFIENKLCVIGE